MTKLYKYRIWFFMLTKRLLHQWSFVILLCLIPVSVLLTNLAMSDESGIVHIMLCSEDNDPKALASTKTLLESDSIIRFSVCDSKDEAKKAVISHQVDAAWIFSKNYSEKIDNYVKHPISADAAITIIEREPSVALKIAIEKLFGTVYSDFSFSIYNNFVYSELVDEKTFPAETVKKYYETMENGNSIVTIERLDGKASSTNRQVTYLTAPIRGILSLMIVLCTLTAALYFLKEQAMGKFSWLPPTKRIIPALASCFSAACLSSVTVFISLLCSGLSTNILREVLSMFLLIISVTGFCCVFAVLFRSAGKFGAIIPSLIIIMLVLSPIFFNLKILKPIRLMLPLHYYLYSIYDSTYYLYTLLYCIATYTVAFVLNLLLSARKSMATM